MNRRAGRPSRSPVSRDKIVHAALALLERRGLAGLTMRALAARLGVDPMALYHYFPDKHALLRAAADSLYGSFTVPPARGWRRRLEALALAYLDLIAPAGELVRYLTARGDAVGVAARHFDARFREAVGTAIAPRHHNVARDVLVDFLHGFALALPRTGLTAPVRAHLRAELAVILRGIAALRR